MGAVGGLQLTELTGEASLKHVNAIISALFSVRYFRRSTDLIINQGRYTQASSEFLIDFFLLSSDCQY
jgi:hypothetical protein